MLLSQLECSIASAPAVFILDCPNEDFHRETFGGSARKKAFTIGVDSVMDS